MGLINDKGEFLNKNYINLLELFNPVQTGFFWTETTKITLVITNLCYMSNTICLAHHIKYVLHI